MFEVFRNKSGRASCRVCGLTITKGEWTVRQRSYHHNESCHFECLANQKNDKKKLMKKINKMKYYESSDQYEIIIHHLLEFIDDEKLTKCIIKIKNQNRL
jgi:hypothetical protein